MSCCVDIEICDKKLIDSAPRHLLVDGKLVLCASVSLTRKREELNDLGAIKKEGALAFGLDETDLTRFLFDRYINPLVFNQNYVDIPVIAMAKGKVLNLDTLCLLGYENKTYEVQLNQSESHWSEKAKTCCLNEAGYDPFNYDIFSLENNWINEAVYQDGGAGYYFGLVNYGNVDSLLGIDHVKPLFHKLALAQKLFCKIGWNFRSPVFESEWGRRQVAYLAPNLGEDFFKTFFQFNVGTSDEQVLNLQAGGPPSIDQIRFNDEQDPYYDNGVGGTGFYNTSSFWAENLCGRYEFCIEFDITSVTDPNAGFSIQLVIGSSIVETFNVQPLQFSDKVVFCSSDFVISPGETVQFAFTTINNTNNITIAPGAIFYNKPISPSIGCGNDTVALDPNAYLSCDITLLDLVKGMMHDVSGIIRTDNATKTVYLYSGYEAQVFDEKVEGYFVDDLVTINADGRHPMSDIACNSLKIRLPKNRPFRYCELGYADSSDDYISSLNLTTEPWRKKIDFGTALTEETKYNLNPLFEPTLDKELDELAVFPPDPDITNSPGDPDPVIIPTMWDNTDGDDESVSIGPRQLTAVGYIKQPYTDLDGVVRYRMWRFNGAQGPYFPYVSQCPIENVVDLNEDPVPIYYNVYGDEDKEFDQYSMFWKEEVKRLQYGVQHNYLARLKLSDYCLLDFRKKYCLEYLGSTYYARLLEIKDFRICSQLTTPIVFEPEVNRVC